MTYTTIYIKPALTDQAGQCRIYSTQAIFNSTAGRHYDQHPHLWNEVGIMSSRGKLVCFDGPDFQRQDLLDCQPLMAGLTFTYSESGVAA